MGCTVYIDESGDTGISTVRSRNTPGSSEYFAMGAIVMQPATEIHARKILEDLQHDFRKTKRWKHATDLNHTQRVHFCREISKLHVRCFGVISYKPTLANYADEISWEPDKFYNKCAKYLLEKVGSYLNRVHPRLHQPRIVFEERNHDYDMLIRYIGKVKENPIYSQSKDLNCINPFGITSEKKNNEDLLRYADMVSHALYSCVNLTPDNFRIPETRYLAELSNRFATDQVGHVLGSGIKCIKGIDVLDVEPEVLKFLKGLRGLPMPRSLR